MNLILSRLPSPMGELLLVTDEAGQVHALDFGDHRARLRRLLREYHGDVTLTEGEAPQTVIEAMRRYFEGDLNALESLPVAKLGNELQQRVWQALRQIPVGQTTSYGELATKLGYADPRAAIEVGAANASNPIGIIVPCHRVIGKDGNLKGYAGGLPRKKWLLTHEGALGKEVEPAERVQGQTISLFE